MPLCPCAWFLYYNEAEIMVKDILADFHVTFAMNLYNFDNIWQEICKACIGKSLNAGHATSIGCVYVFADMAPSLVPLKFCSHMEISTKSIFSMTEIACRTL